jgi:hypothetical protein
VFLAVGVVGICLLFSKDASERRPGLGCGTLFLGVGIGGALWPFLRRRETNGPQQVFIHLFDMHCDAIFFPMSRAKELLTIFGAGLFVFGVTTIMLVTDNNEYRVKGGIASVFYVGVLVLGVKSLLGPRRGLYVVPDGIIWNELFRAPCFIPWPAITRASLFNKKAQYVSKPLLSFGIDVSNMQSVKTTKFTRDTFRKSKARHGWNFYFYEETIVTPITLVAQTVQYYWSHPEDRTEIGTANALARIEKIEAVFV